MAAKAAVVSVIALGLAISVIVGRRRCANLQTGKQEDQEGQPVAREHSLHIKTRVIEKCDSGYSEESSSTLVFPQPSLEIAAADQLTPKVVVMESPKDPPARLGHVSRSETTVDEFVSLVDDKVAASTAVLPVPMPVPPSGPSVASSYSVNSATQTNAQPSVRHVCCKRQPLLSRLFGCCFHPAQLQQHQLTPRGAYIARYAQHGHAWPSRSQG